MEDMRNSPKQLLNERTKQKTRKREETKNAAKPIYRLGKPYQKTQMFHTIYNSNACFI